MISSGIFSLIFIGFGFGMSPSGSSVKTLEKYFARISALILSSSVFSDLGSIGSRCRSAISSLVFHLDFIYFQIDLCLSLSFCDRSFSYCFFSLFYHWLNLISCSILFLSYFWIIVIYNLFWQDIFFLFFPSSSYPLEIYFYFFLIVFWNFRVCIYPVRISKYLQISFNLYL